MLLQRPRRSCHRNHGERLLASSLFNIFLSSLRVKTLDHVGIYVKDLDEAVSFYEILLEFTVHSRLFDNGIHIVHMDMGSALLQSKQSGVPGPPGAGKTTIVKDNCNINAILCVFFTCLDRQ